MNLLLPPPHVCQSRPLPRLTPMAPGDPRDPSPPQGGKESRPAAEPSRPGTTKRPDGGWGWEGRAKTPQLPDRSRDPSPFCRRASPPPPRAKLPFGARRQKQATKPGQGPRGRTALPRDPHPILPPCLALPPPRAKLPFWAGRAKQPGQGPREDGRPFPCPPPRLAPAAPTLTASAPRPRRARLASAPAGPLALGMPASAARSLPLLPGGGAGGSSSSGGGGGASPAPAAKRATERGRGAFKLAPPVPPPCDQPGGRRQRGREWSGRRQPGPSPSGTRIRKEPAPPTRPPRLPPLPRTRRQSAGAFTRPPLRDARGAAPPAGAPGWKDEERRPEGSCLAREGPSTEGSFPARNASGASSHNQGRCTCGWAAAWLWPAFLDAEGRAQGGWECGVR